MRCTAARTNGEPCKRAAIAGATVCRVHGGNAPQVKAKAAVRAELMRWRADQATDDPGETLLRLITQSRMRADLYAGLLEQAYEAAERLAQAEQSHDLDLSEDACRDLDVVLQAGGVAALVGKTYGAAGKDGIVYATGEAIRGLAVLEAAERDRCANFCRIAIAAGLEERRVRVAERQVELVRAALDAALTDAGLADRKREVLAGVGRHLRLAAG